MHVCAPTLLDFLSGYPFSTSEQIFPTCDDFRLLDSQSKELYRVPTWAAEPAGQPTNKAILLEFNQSERLIHGPG